MIAAPEAWRPPISPKQQKLMDDMQQLILLSGPRKASKTIGGLHRLVAHAWECPLGKISMCGRALTDNFDGGTWVDLVDTVIPIWIDAGFGMEWVTRPKMDGLTHKMSCEITNQFGRPCRIQLDSVRNEDEVERIYRSKRFSMIYMTELSNFKYRKTFDIILEALRVIGLPDSQHVLIGDTNPAEEGEDSWIHNLWWTFRLADDEALLEYVEEIGSEEQKAIQLQALKELQKKLSVHEYTIDDNIWLTEAQKREQFARYAHSRDLLDRFYYGRWKKAATASLFSDVFRPSIHVIGDSQDSQRSDPEILLPEEKCSALGTGWDLGDRNNSWQCIEKCFRLECACGKELGHDGDCTKKHEERAVSVFKILDEMVEVGPNMPLDEIVEAVLEKMDFWELAAGQSLIWRHISDRSAFDRYDKIADTYEYKQVYLLSDGKIELERGPVKKRGSVQQRVNLVRKLLFQDRLFVSAQCVRTIEMLNNIQKGKLTAIDPKSPYKHPFDSLTYYLCMECFDELEREIRNQTLGTAQPTGIVSVRLA